MYTFNTALLSLSALLIFSAASSSDSVKFTESIQQVSGDPLYLKTTAISTPEPANLFVQKAMLYYFQLLNAQQKEEAQKFNIVEHNKTWDLCSALIACTTNEASSKKRTCILVHMSGATPPSPRDFNQDKDKATLLLQAALQYIKEHESAQEVETQANDYRRATPQEVLDFVKENGAQEVADGTYVFPLKKD